ncbi:MAG: hypothetical protein PF508_04680 [Spirochaeta sp.]|jgi:dTDP-glucose pyrophosphorylase|nr:hypothetical protein [Spirochaeta sp.]
MRVNLIPMAGEGQRYKDAGFTTPKPLIEIAGVPMVVRAAQALPPADRWIFVVREKHLRESPIQDVLSQFFDDPIIVSVDHLTDGQARTCMLAKDHIPADAALTIGPSDNDMTYDTARAERWFADPEIDGWIWTFRRNPAVLQDPRMYGWVRVVENNSAVAGSDTTALGVSCKIPISDTPIDDHAIIGAFTFKQARSFFDAFDEMVEKDERINGELYVDTAADVAIRHGRKIHAFEIDRYIGWGTPRDLEIYHYWRGYFAPTGRGLD